MSAATILAKIDAAIEARVDGGLVEAYSVGGVDFRLSPLEDLMRLRDRYAGLAAASANTGGGRWSLARRRCE